MRLITCLLIAAAAPAAIRVTLTPSVPSPAPVGYMVTWTAESDAASDTLWYRFRTRLAGGEFATIRDFGPVDILDWTASEREGIYEIEGEKYTLRQKNEQGKLVTYPNPQEAEKVKAPLLKYGVFLQNILDFVIIAFVIFLLIRQVNKLLVKPAPAPAPEPSKEEKLLAEIRDILKARSAVP